jgi:hypothetical protein
VAATPSTVFARDLAAFRSGNHAEGRKAPAKMRPIVRLLYALTLDQVEAALYSETN